MLFTRYIRNNPYRYDLTQINKKYQELSKKDFNENQNIKDYNVIADSIMSLTGSYTNKKIFDQLPNEPSLQRIPTYSSDYPDLFPPDQLRHMTERMEGNSHPLLSRGTSQMFYDFQNDIKIPKPSRSFSNEYAMQIPMLSQTKSINNESNYEARKNFKANGNMQMQENFFYGGLTGTSLNQQQSNSNYIPAYNLNNIDELSMLPNLQINKQSSNISIPDDLCLPGLNKYNSVLSLKLDK